MWSTVKGFCIVTEAEIDMLFWNSLAFSIIQQMLAIWSLVSQPFLSPACLLVVSPAQSCLTLCDPMDCSPPGSFVHAILQARILEWISIPFSRGSSWSRDRILGLLHCRQVLFCLSHQGSSDGFSWSCGIKKLIKLIKNCLPLHSPPICFPPLSSYMCVPNSTSELHPMEGQCNTNSLSFWCSWERKDIGQELSGLSVQLSVSYSWSESKWHNLNPYWYSLRVWRIKYSTFSFPGYQVLFLKGQKSFNKTSFFDNTLFSRFTKATHFHWSVFEGLLTGLWVFLSRASYYQKKRKERKNATSFRASFFFFFFRVSLKKYKIDPVSMA